MFKILLKTILVLVFLVVSVSYTYAQEETVNLVKESQLSYGVNVYFFWGDGCPHCTFEKPFLAGLENKYPSIKVQAYEVWKSEKYRNYLVEVAKKLNIDVLGVPFTVVGDEVFIGYSESLIAKQIESKVVFCLSNRCSDSVAEIVGLTSPTLQDSSNEPSDLYAENKDKKDEPLNSQRKIIPEKITFPLIGEIQTSNLSLPVFTIVLGALDGFNPCAMWTLLFLISLLLGMKDKRRRWILGTAFIVASAFVYFLFMAAWLNLIIFIGFIAWVRIVIGLVAIGGGSYNLKEFFTNKNSGCKVTGGEKRQLVFEKLKSVTHQRSFLLALGGIILLAFAVNLVELICSAGLPVIFTQVLALSEIPKWQHYMYMFLYILIFMLDDLFVFFTAMITLEMTGISTKYSRMSHLVGGILMIIIGLLLIFKPELLMLG
jgi:thiol-disulfide isomerase/thioredoxin